MKALLITLMLLVPVTTAYAAPIADGGYTLTDMDFWVAPHPELFFTLGHATLGMFGDTLVAAGVVVGGATGMPLTFAAQAATLRIENDVRLYGSALFWLNGQPFPAKDAFFSSPAPYQLEVSPHGEVFAWIDVDGGGDFKGQIPEPALIALFGLGLLTTSIHFSRLLP